jgi:hypothetical protein
MVPSLSLLIYIALFLKPVSDKSTFLHERDLIKASRPLNKVLHENRGGLEYIYDKLKGTEQMLHKNKVTIHMRKILKSDKRFDDMELHKHFVYSLEIVVDEIADSLKYMFLSFSEYLEYVVRLALALYEDRKDLSFEYKACEFIKILFEADGILDPLKAKLKSPEVDISYHAINEEEDCC